MSGFGKKKEPKSPSFWDLRENNARYPATRGFWQGMRFGAEGALIGAPLIAFEVGRAQRGEAIPTLIGRSAGLVSYPAVAGLFSAAIAVTCPWMKFIGFAGGMAALYPDQLLQDSIIRGVRMMTAAAQHMRRVETGGWYQDSMRAQQTRMQGIAEMSGALGASRAYLGQEAALMHR